MNKFIPFSLLLLILFYSCGNDESEPVIEDEGPGVDACGNETAETVNDKRCLYTVSTLTENFAGSGGLAVDSEGFIYVADFGDQLSFANGTTVKKIDPSTGELSPFIAGQDGASGNAFAANGDYFQANIRGSFLTLVTSAGIQSKYTNEGFASPVGVAVDPEGNVYVCNCASASIQKVDTDKVSTRFVGDNLLNCPNGLTIDDDGNLYASNFNDGLVVKVDPNGVASQFANIPGGSNAHITYGNGVLYVLSRGNKVYEITLDGTISVLAGTGDHGNDDGDGDQATFSLPNGIDLSPDGSKIYVTSKVVGQGTQLNPVVVRVVQLK